MTNITDLDPDTVTARMLALDGRWDARTRRWIVPPDRAPELVGFLTELRLTARAVGAASIARSRELICAAASP